MKTYLVYQNQIQGLSAVLETVKTIEKIAASSVHFLRQETESLAAYLQNLETTLARLALFYPKKDHPLLTQNTAGDRALLIISGDKGLVGSLWHDLINALRDKLHHYQAISVVGEVGRRFLVEDKIELLQSFSLSSEVSEKNTPDQIAEFFFQNFKNKKFSQVDILYPRFLSLIQQQPTFIPFLPFRYFLAQANSSQPAAPGLPIFEPSPKKIFQQLLDRYIAVFLHRLILETRLSELSARTAAMEHASAKAADLIKQLKTQFRKERRQLITQRQLESFAAHKMTN